MEFLFTDSYPTDDEGEEVFVPYEAPGDMHEPKPYTGEMDWLPIGNDSDNE